MTNLSTKISELMAQKRMGAPDIERETGLNRNTVYSIISGHTKNPSANNLQLIAKALGVKLENLLIDNEEIKIDNLSHEEMKVLADAAAVTINIVIEKNLYCSLNKLFSLIKEVYQYSIKSTPFFVDSKFIDWLTEKHKEKDQEE